MGLENYKNYFIYDALAKNGVMKIYVPKDISVLNIDDHIDAITNILKDGIETDFVHNMRIIISWGGDVECALGIGDYWFNLFMWYMILKTNQEIKPKHIFWQPELRKFHLKDFVDEFIAHKYNKINIDSKKLNSIICDGLCKYSSIELFSYYLANTINNEDDIQLMNASDEFFNLKHCSLKNVPFEDVKDEGMKITTRAIEIIKNSKNLIGYEHGLANSFRAKEAINDRQYKEASFNIGTKSNGSGTVYPYIIDKSFSTGGVNDPLSYEIESSTARAAQIMSKKNVGESGDFARLLGINNTDTILNKTGYECMSNHFIRYEIKTPKHLSMIKNRYYRFNPRGMDHLINHKDMSLVGKTVYLHSPITCASNANGHGICKKCYGDLYYTNLDINVGKIAAEILSSQLTQTLLSAKHLLETKIVKINWNDEFLDFFNVDINTISLAEDNFEDDSDLRAYHMIIDPESIVLENDDDSTSYYNDDGEEIIVQATETYNEYITKFIIETPDGKKIECCSAEQDSLYISNDFNKVIRKKAYNKENKIVVPLNVMTDIPLFYIKINNNEISKTMDNIISTIDKTSVTCSLTKDEAVQKLCDLIVESGLVIDSIHLEVILSNQIVDYNNILKKPNWANSDAKYKLLTLNQALTNNPSVIISMLYKDLGKVLYNPLTYNKKAPSFYDLFFMEAPQNYMDDDLIVEKVDSIRDPEKKLQMFTLVDKNKPRNI